MRQPLTKIENSMQHMNPDELPSLVVRYFQEEVVGRSPHTLYARKNDLGKFCSFYRNLNGHLRVRELMPRDVKFFINDLQSQGYAPSSINRFVGSVRALGSWLIQNGFLKIHPCKSIKDLHVDLGPPKAPRDREYHRLRKTADALARASNGRNSQGFRDLVLLETLGASGLRITELLSIKMDQFKGKKFNSIHCKGGKVRSVSIKTETCELIQEYVSHHRVQGSDYLFTSKSGQRLDRVTAWKSLKRIARITSANLPPEEKIDLYPHQLRHRHCYKAREAKDAVFAATRLGHSSLNFVQRYSQETPEEERNLIEQMD